MKQVNRIDMGLLLAMNVCKYKIQLLDSDQNNENITINPAKMDRINKRIIEQTHKRLLQSIRPFKNNLQIVTSGATMTQHINH